MKEEPIIIGYDFGRENDYSYRSEIIVNGPMIFNQLWDSYDENEPIIRCLNELEYYKLGGSNIGEGYVIWIPNIDIGGAYVFHINSAPAPIKFGLSDCSDEAAVFPSKYAASIVLGMMATWWTEPYDELFDPKEGFKLYSTANQREYVLKYSEIWDARDLI